MSFFKRKEIYEVKYKKNMYNYTHNVLKDLYEQEIVEFMIDYSKNNLKNLDFEKKVLKDLDNNVFWNDWRWSIEESFIRREDFKKPLIAKNDKYSEGYLDFVLRINN